MHYEESKDPEEGWHFVKKTDDYEVWQRCDPDEPVHLVRVIFSGLANFFFWGGGGIGIWN